MINSNLMLCLVTETVTGNDLCPELQDVDAFYTAYFKLKKLVHSDFARSFASMRLQVLLSLFNLHVLLNSDREMLAQKSVPHRDFYKVRKVTNNLLKVEM